MTSASSPAPSGHERATPSETSRTASPMPSTRSGEQPAAGAALAAASPVLDTEPPVAVTDLSVAFGSTLVLSSIDMTVTTGESVALLGANGSGKSTLIKTILGLNPIRTGSVRLFGHDLEHRSRVSWSRIGYVPQRVGAASGVPATALEVCGKEETDAPVWVVSGLVVDPDARRQGVGRRLLAAVLGTVEVLEPGAPVYSVVSATDHTSIALHMVLGFTQVARGPELAGITFEGGMGVLLRYPA